MVQKISDKRKSFVDVLKSFFAPYFSEKEQILKILNENYSKEISIAKMMWEHAEIIPFDFLREKLKKIAEEEKRHAEKLKEKIVELGGELNPVSKIYNTRVESIHNQRGFRSLVADLEFDEEIYEDYISQINKIEDEDLKNLLREIIRDEARHKEILMDMIMRLC